MELIALNKRFASYAGTLFSRKALRVDRETMMPNEVGELNRHIQYFLRDLSPHLLTPAALSCLEYLVRKYKVHVYNIHSVLYASLPYHRTLVFRKILSILYVRGTRWSWLEALQKSDATIERSIFAKQCAKNPAGFFNYVLQITKANAQERHPCSLLTSFLFFVVSEYVDHQSEIKEEVLVKILSACVFPGIGSQATDSQSASLLLVLQLSRKLPLSPSLVSALFVEVTRRCHVDLQAQGLQVLATLCANQADFAAIPPKATKNLVRMPNFVDHLASMSARSGAEARDTHRFFRVLLPSLVAFCPTHENYANILVRTIAEADLAPHLEFLVRTLVTHLCETIARAEEGKRAQALASDHVYLGKVFGALDDKYAASFDLILNKEIEASPANRDRKDLKKDVVDYFADLFGGTLRQPIGDTLMTLQAAIDSSQAQVRKHALARVFELQHTRGKISDKISKDFLHQALLRRIDDEDESIAHLAFQQDELLRVAPGLLCEKILFLVRDYLRAPEDSHQRKRKYVKAKMALKFLLKKFCPKHKNSAATTAAVVRIIFPALLVERAHRKLAHDALKLAAKSKSIDLFGNLLNRKKAFKKYASALEANSGGKKAAKAAKGSQDGNATKKMTKGHKDCAVNQTTVVALAEALASMSVANAASVVPALVSDATSSHLCLLVLCRALGDKSLGEDKREYLHKVAWDCVHASWSEMGKRKHEAHDGGHWTKDGAPGVGHFELLAQDTQGARAQVLERILLLLLDGLSLTATKYTEVLVSILQMESLQKSLGFTDLALTKLAASAEASSKKNDKKPWLVQVYFNCADAGVDKEAVRRTRARILRIFLIRLTSTNTRLMKMVEEQAVAKKRGHMHKHHHVNGNGNGAGHGSSNGGTGTGSVGLGVDLELCLPWLLSALCEGSEAASRSALEILDLLAGMIKSGALRDHSVASKLPSLADFISTALAKSASGLTTGHVTLSEVLESFCGRGQAAERQKQDRARDLVDFLLDSSVRYPYKEIAVNLVGALGSVGSDEGRVKALSKLLRKELDKYTDASFAFANDARITERDISLLSNILSAFRIHPTPGEDENAKALSLGSPEWFDCFVACMHFPSRHDLGWRVRRAAVGAVSGALLASLSTQEERDTLVHALVFLSHKDDAELVRSVAVEALETVERDASAMIPLLTALRTASADLIDQGKPAGASKAKPAAKRTRRADKTAVQNKFKWVKEVLEDRGTLGLGTTILALEALNVTEFENLGRLAQPLIGTLDLLVHLHQAASGQDLEGEGEGEGGKDAREVAMAAAAAKAFQSKEIDVTSQARYGIELGLQTLYEAALCAPSSKALRQSILSLSLKCLGLVDQPSVHEYALDNLNQVMDGLPKRELASHASVVVAAVMEVLGAHAAHKRAATSSANKRFFASVLAVLKPFLSQKATKAALLEEISGKVTDFKRGDQEVFFSLARQIWTDPSGDAKDADAEASDLLFSLMEKAFDRPEARELASLICERYTGAQCLDSFDRLLSLSSPETLGTKISFVAQTIAANAGQYKEAEARVKERVIRKVVAQASESERGGEEEALLGNLLEKLEQVSTEGSYVAALLLLCGESEAKKDRTILLRSLDLLAHKIANHQGKFKSEVGSDIFDTMSGALERATDEAIKQGVLRTLEASLRHLKDASVLALAETLLAEEDGGEGETMASSTAGVSFLGSCVKQLKARVIPLLPRVTGRVLGGLTKAVEAMAAGLDSASAKEACAQATQGGLQALGRIFSNHGGMTGPYLSGIFALWKDLMSEASGSPYLEDSGIDLLSTISDHVPIRILLPALLEAMRAPCDPLTLRPLVETLRALVDAMDHALVKSNHFEVVNFILSALDGRRRHPQCASAQSAIDQGYLELESALADCFVSLVMKLSEATFRPVFLHLVDWSAKGAASDADVVTVGLSRTISLFHVVAKMTDKLRSIIVPYFKHLVEPACHWLEEREREPSGGKTSDKAGGKKKRAKVSPSGNVARSSMEMSVALWTLKTQIVHALAKCFAFDTVGFTDEAKFEEILPALLHSLSAEPAPAVAREVDRASAILLRTKAQTKMGEDENEDGDSALQTYRDLDIAAKETCDCLSAFAIAGNNDAIWKRFNNKVLMCTRSDSVRIKLCCIEVASRLAHHLKEDYIILIAETVPFIAELLEDTEDAVQAACKAFVRKLEDISGEDLSEYIG